MVGSFADGVGTFHGGDTLDGKPIKLRFLWTMTARDVPCWEQAFSSNRAGLGKRTVKKSEFFCRHARNIGHGRRFPKWQFVRGLFLGEIDLDEFHA